MAAITKTRLQEACNSAATRLTAEMKDAQWGAVTRTICTLYAKYLFEALEAKE